MLSESSSTYWVNILERESWLVLNVEDRKLGIIITYPESGKEYLKAAGFHLGQSRFVGQRQNVMSIKVEQIPKIRHKDLLSKIGEALPVELRELPILFL